MDSLANAGVSSITNPATSRFCGTDPWCVVVLAHVRTVPKIGYTAEHIKTGKFSFVSTIIYEQQARAYIANELPTGWGSRVFKLDLSLKASSLDSPHDVDRLDRAVPSSS